ncbi:PadR family transcriptional regulator [Micromonospora rifamycinica]|uniref:DNA-binding transcriptional regulator, PadR family n=1 Tax=Micromonospora rifamycinica TaxID=291594 RepID=A0A1C5JSN4_9ACTN|nr:MULTISPECIES: PadR family transcriptional regulator [Micromonospora]WFE63106.1 PadR family transcriptional regulator [Micromonospora sp. WMMD714]WFE95518.1 PadR family transcriptional regulator [Micromonospora sp. WMMD987]SCG73259.1 DNA-binding transcriptional regulator, PadR family [Micromonospora rifamycinica]
MLELAILGLLQEAPMHGYELRKELTAKLGAIRAAISYGSLYPTLRRLQAAGWITEAAGTPATAEEVPALTSRRGRVVYKITAEGKERFAQLIAQAGPETYDDTGFGVHFAFFARTDQATRLRILEGRRRTIEERREGLRDVLGRAAERLDAYTLELQRHGLDACEREVRWLEELIANERSGRAPVVPRSGTTDGPRDNNSPPPPGASRNERP